MKPMVLVRIGLAVLLVVLAGCGGAKIPGNYLSRQAGLSTQDPKLNHLTYYDTWTFVPTETRRGVFKILSDEVDGFIILKNGQGQTIQTGSAAGWDEDGNFNGDATLNAVLTQGETYTVIATSETADMTGLYWMVWPDWVTMTGAGT